MWQPAAPVGNPQGSAVQGSAVRYTSSQYASSPQPPASGLSGLSGGYPVPSPTPHQQAQWGVQPAGMPRYASADGSSAAAVLAATYGAGLRQFSTEVSPSPGALRHAQQPMSAAYQTSGQYGFVGAPSSYHQAPAMGQGQFSFHNSQQLRSPQAFQFDASPAAASSEGQAATASTAVA
eukprot:CAMPEP_0177247442 /NCGR_PEP_ID=MMETSP0367-20130122/51583_1 /TAXON_ID=447022 ORGANISM="Scrippsiella hangoei-like, Strain SHHI-4" /NCGR_SAMPLE_ID=MMETSP0367 /ASSEMBLY_ACC=CAM_ASM_000362 /LENGTH=177 /DNA_ID=CAMNT_0018699605 /DNA_START=35 /DNA_END=565 /DNA_ORIENTATION=-